MELLSPRALWLLTGLVPLIVLYVLRTEHARLRVPSTWLWAAAARDVVARRPFKKLVARVPLVLQAFALAAIALALARPAARGRAILGDHVALVVDTSASMGAVARPGDAATRLDHAKRAAAEVIAAIGPEADAFVIEAASDARVVAPRERDARQLRAAIDQLVVSEVEGDLPRAVALAVDRLRPLGGTRRIVVVTDAAGAAATVGPAGIDLSLVTVGEPADNAGIVRLDVRAAADPKALRDQAQVFAMIESFGAKPRDAYVTLTVEGHPEPVASRRVLLAPGEKTPVVLTFEPRPEDVGVGLYVQLAPGDALAADDAAYGRVPFGRKMPVTIATDAPRSWLTRALRADPGVSLQELTLAQLSTVNVDPDALVVVEGACPTPARGGDVGGDRVVVAPPRGPCMGFDVGDIVEPPALTSWGVGDPRLRFLTFDGIHIAHARPLDAPGSRSALLRAGTLTLMADASSPGRTATLLGFDVGESDWPLQASFVVFVQNLVEGARARRAQEAVGSLTTGNPLRFAVPAGVTRLRVDGPGRDDLDVAASDGFAVLPPARRAGLYHARWTSPHVGRTLIAANLTSASESDLRATAPASVAPSAENAAIAPSPREALPHAERGAWVALLAVLLLASDVAWMTRRGSRAAGPRVTRSRS